MIERSERLSGREERAAVSKPVALVPGVRALLPRYSSIEDPVAELRAACTSAAATLGPRVRVVASAYAGFEVGAAVVASLGASVVESGETGVLVVGNGSATRTEKAPGYLDPRAEGFDSDLRAALMLQPVALASLNLALASELWADVPALLQLPDLVAGPASVLYDDAPFGVQYWVITWAGSTG